MFDKIPTDVIEALEYEIARAGLEYVDNYRAYRRSDGFLKEEFEKARERGCCGCYEVGVVAENGAHWIVGCNYGH